VFGGLTVACITKLHYTTFLVFIYISAILEIITLSRTSNYNYACNIPIQYLRVFIVVTRNNHNINNNYNNYHNSDNYNSIVNDNNDNANNHTRAIDDLW